MARKKKKPPFALVWSSLRPLHWGKGLIVLLPMLLSYEAITLHNIIYGLLAMAAFVAASCCVYVLNDIWDARKDRHHPLRRLRPIAAKDLPISQGFTLAALCAGISIGFLSALSYEHALIIGFYFILNILYSLMFRSIAGVDVLSIALGYALRALMGYYAMEVESSPFVIAMVFMFGVFVTFALRYHEIKRLGQPKDAQLGTYTLTMLDRMIMISCTTSMLLYTLYATHMAQRLNDIGALLSVVLIVLASFRFLKKIYYSKKAESLSSIFVKDKIFTASIVLWVLNLQLL